MLQHRTKLPATLLAAAGLLAILPSPNQQAVAAEEARTPRLDRQGDPLPEGVLARIGSGRMRHFARHAAPLAFTRDGQSLVSGGEGSTCIWDAATGKLRHRFALDGRMDVCSAIAFHSDGVLAASFASDKGDLLLQLLDPDRGKVRRRMVLPDQVMVASPVFSRDGKQLASAYEKNAVRLYETTTGRELLRIPVAGNWARKLAFAPDGKSLAFTDFTDKVHIHATSDGKCVQPCNAKETAFPDSPFRRMAAGLPAPIEEAAPAVPKSFSGTAPPVAKKGASVRGDG